MPGSHLFNLGLFQKNFGGNNRIAGVSINLGNTKGRGSSTRMFNYCNQRSANPSGCINQFINVAPATPATPVTPVTPVTSATTILEYSVTQGSNFVWGGVTYTLNTSLPNYSYTAITTSIPASTVQNPTILKSVIFGNNVTSIGANAFYGCTSLTSITIPNSVTTIGQEAFLNCTGLTSVIIPNSATIISSYAVFQGCSSLTSITIGNLVTSIGISVFQNCNSLTSITIPNSVTTIGVAAFQSCSSLTSITIPNSVLTIGTNAFLSSGLATVYISNATASALGSLLSPPQVWTSPGTVLSPHFYGAPNTVTLTPPDTTILEYNTSQGPSFTWGSVTFTINTNLPNFSYTAITTSIPASTVPDYANLIRVIFGNNVTSIGSTVFDSCTNLTSVTLPTNLSFTTINDSVFTNCSALTSVTIPNSVTTINDDAFGYCSSLSSIKIPNSVTSIGIGVFESCTGLTSVTIGTSVTSIGSNAFQNCSSLTSITIPASVTFIDTDAFQISGLNTVHIAISPQTISTIVFTAGTTVSFFGKANVNIVSP